MSYLIRRVGDYQLACDLMQESFTRIYEKYRSGEMTPQLLYTIGRHLAIDALRKGEKPRSFPEANDPPDESHERNVLVRDEYRRVLAAMHHLEDDERDLLALVVSSEMPYREVALITGMSEANVKVKIHRARKKLRALLEGESGER